MGRSGSCVTCYAPKRVEIEAARAAGSSYADLARRFGVAATSIRRHFREGHAPKPAPASRVVTRQFLEDLAAEFSLTFVDILRHHVLCRGGDVATKDDEEAHELCELLADGEPCCG